MLARNCGFPDGYLVDWRGRVAWCQPAEFLSFRGVMAAVRRRLAIAGLELEALASRTPHREHVELMALVRRRVEGKYGVERTAAAGPEMTPAGA